MAKLQHRVHLDVLQKMIYRLSGDLDETTRRRLEGVIKTYQRLYVE